MVSIITHLLDKYDLQVTDVNPRVDYNFEFRELSSSRYAVSDYGIDGDSYYTDVTISGRSSYVDQFTVELESLRKNRQAILITDIDTDTLKIFSDEIDHLNGLSVYVKKWDVMKSDFLNKKELTLTFKLITKPFVNSGAKPFPTLTCLGFSVDNGYVPLTVLNTTYNDSDYMTDKEQLRYTFRGSYNLSLEENIDLLDFYRFQRGQSFQIAPNQLGVEYPFGIVAGNGTHTVVLSKISYKYLSPTRRSTELILEKVRQ